ncbi:hypothetical protein DFJ73DRAFT_569250 [Zopfochytrium polystomum]|nr:hypothetical protein DFJ73DRAFT_569250 [Zopfochytrium polystomum]
MSTVAPPFVQNGCLYLDDQSPCGPDYYGYPVATQPLSGLAFTDYASFNSFVKARFDEPTIEAAIHNAYGCSATPTFDLADAINSMRFQITYYCANLVAVALSSQQCSLLPVASTTQYPLGPLVCQSSCDLSSASYSRILLNSDVCTNQTAATARSVSFANECTTIASLLPNNNNYCLDGVSGSPNEKLYCGYRSKELALAHCPEVTDSCCVNFLAANPSTSSSSSANGQSTGAANTASSSATTSSSGAAASGSATGLSTSNSSSSSGVNMVIIIPIVVVVAALIIIGVISFFIYSKRRRTAPAPPIDLKVYPSSLAGNRGVKPIRLDDQAERRCWLRRSLPFRRKSELWVQRAVVEQWIRSQWVQQQWRLPQRRLQ